MMREKGGQYWVKEKRGEGGKRGDGMYEEGTEEEGTEEAGTEEGGKGRSEVGSKKEEMKHWISE
jgi:hypothetical protein